MSWTATTTSAVTSNMTATTSKLHLTPRKAIAPNRTTTTEYSLHTRSSAYAYSFTAASLAPVFARDVQGLVEDHAKDQRDNFFWLGTHPVRMVELVGIVVDTWKREFKIGFCLDDGTATAECSRRYTPTADDTSVLPEIGDTVRVVGKVYVRRRGVEKDHLLEFERNAWKVVSAGAEARHILNVASLHVDRYSKPFNIPATPATAPTSPMKSMPTTPSTHSNTIQASPSTANPTRAAPPPSFTLMSKRPPISTATWAPTPAPSATLTHPSNLRTKQRTRNTFRIYFNAYISAAPHLVLAGEGAVFGRPHAKDKMPSGDISVTSTLPAESQAAWTQLTPTPKRRKLSEPEDTPRASIRARPATSAPAAAETDGIGFTRAFLQHVPELAELAQAVARVERHMRPPAGQARPHSRAEKEAADCAAAEGIFVWALRTLLEHGAIVLHEGAVYAHDPPNGVCVVAYGGNEAYVPLTPDLLRAPVLQVLARTGRRRPSAEDIAKTLQRYDDRWRCVGAWQVQLVLDQLAQDA